MMYILALHYLVSVCTPNDGCDTPEIQTSYGVMWSEQTCMNAGSEAVKTQNYKRAIAYDCIARPMVVKP